MIRLPFVIETDLAAAQTAVASVVARHGVVLLPTETFYGLAGDPRSSHAIRRIGELKGRPTDMALPVLCADWAQVSSLVVVPEAFRPRLTALWPAALTAVMPVITRVAAGAPSSLAIRIPAHPLLRQLLASTGPLTATSANRHGAPSCVDPDAALASLLAPTDLVLDGGATPGGAASTLVDLTRPAPRLLREGPVPWT